MKKSIMLSMLLAASGLHSAKEIELKLSLDVESYFILEQWLHDHAAYRGTTEQIEYYVVNPSEHVWDYSAGFKDTLKTLRVRLENSGDSVCYKYRQLDPITKRTMHRDEYETKVENGAHMLEILTKMGYTQRTRVEKKRTIYRVREFEIVLDDVSELGLFVEIELKESVESVPLGIANIEMLLRDIGIRRYIQHDRGYIHMLWNPDYDFGITRTIQ